MNKSFTYVIAPDGCAAYLTTGKEYDVINIIEYSEKSGKYLFTIQSDINTTIHVLSKGCSHLNGGDWIVPEIGQFPDNAICEQNRDVETGKKYDDGKLRYDLLPPECLEEIVRVLTFGAKEYGDDNWKNLKDAEKRYYAALMRHIQAHRMGKILDEKSGLPHLAHATTNAIFLLYLQLHDHDTL